MSSTSAPAGLHEKALRLKYSGIDMVCRVFGKTEKTIQMIRTYHSIINPHPSLSPHKKIPHDRKYAMSCRILKIDFNLFLAYICAEKYCNTFLSSLCFDILPNIQSTGSPIVPMGGLN
jgi:hypothetical protein